MAEPPESPLPHRASRHQDTMHILGTASTMLFMPPCNSNISPPQAISHGELDEALLGLVKNVCQAAMSDDINIHAVVVCVKADEDVTPAGPANQLYLCNFCTSQFNAIKNLLVHMKEHIFVCPYCEYRSFSRFSVLAHSLKCHASSRTRYSNVHILKYDVEILNWTAEDFKNNNPKNHLNHLFLPLTEMIHGDAYNDTSSVDYFQSPVEQDADVESLPITPQFTQLSADQSLSACESAVEQDVDVESLPITPQFTQLSADQSLSACESAVEQDVDVESLPVTPQFTQLYSTHNDEPFELDVTEPNSIRREGVFLQYNHASSPDSIGPDGEQYPDSATSRNEALGEIITHLDYSGANTKGKRSIETQILACDEFRKHHSECFVILEDIYGTPYMPASDMARVHLRTINLNTATTSAPPCKNNVSSQMCSQSAISTTIDDDISATALVPSDNVNKITNRSSQGIGNEGGTKGTKHSECRRRQKEQRADRHSDIMKCYYCPKRARTIFAIKIHVKKYHPDLNIIVRNIKQHSHRKRCLHYLCPKCPYSSQDKILLEQHIPTHSTLKTQLKSDGIRRAGGIGQKVSEISTKMCSESAPETRNDDSCTTTFISKRNMNKTPNHASHGEKCGMGIGNKGSSQATKRSGCRSRQKEQRADRQSGIMRCYYCSKQARTIFAIKNHVKKFHPDLNIIVRNMKQHSHRKRCLHYLCPKCPYSSQDKILLEQHIPTHSTLKTQLKSDGTRRAGGIGQKVSEISTKMCSESAPETTNDDNCTTTLTPKGNMNKTPNHASPGDKCDMGIGNKGRSQATKRGCRSHQKEQLADRQSDRMKCYHCPKRARTIFAIKNHVKKYHPDLNIIVRNMKQHSHRQRCLHYLCPKCPYSSQHKILYQQHIPTHSTGKTPLNTDGIHSIGEIGQRVSEISTKMCSESAQETTNDDICTTNLPSKGNMNKTTNHASHGYKCDRGIGSKGSSQATKHNGRQKEQRADRPFGIMRCYYCSKRKGTLSAIKKHVKKCHPDLNIIVRNMKQHSLRQRCLHYLCPKCPYSSQHKILYQQHIPTHSTGKTPLNTDGIHRIGEIGQRISEISTKMCSESAQETTNDDICTTNLMSKGNMNKTPNHASHGYKCDRDIGNKGRSQATKHSGCRSRQKEQRADRQSGIMRCYYCPKRARTIFALKNHVKKIHPDLNIIVRDMKQHDLRQRCLHYLCRKCPYSCQYKNEFEKHILSHSSGNGNSDDIRKSGEIGKSDFGMGLTSNCDDTENHQNVCLSQSAPFQRDPNTDNSILDSYKVGETSLGDIWMRQFNKIDTKWEIPMESSDNIRSVYRPDIAQLWKVASYLVTSVGKANSCSVCQYTSRNYDHVQEHVGRHLGLAIWTCPYCAFKQRRRRPVVGHLKTVHTEFDRFVICCRDYTSGKLTNIADRSVSSLPPLPVLTQTLVKDYAAAVLQRYGKGCSKKTNVDHSAENVCEKQATSREPNLEVSDDKSCELAPLQRDPNADNSILDSYVIGETTLGDIWMRQFNKIDTKRGIPMESSDKIRSVYRPDIAQLWKVASYLVTSVGKTNSCSVCQFTSRSYDHVLEHVGRHLGLAIWTCPYCAFKHRQRMPVVDHLKTVHTELDQFVIRYRGFSSYKFTDMVDRLSAKLPTSAVLTQERVKDYATAVLQLQSKGFPKGTA